MQYLEKVKIRKESYSGESFKNALGLAYQLGADDYREGHPFILPDLEIVSNFVHDAWMQSKRLNGITTRKSEDGEELMVPYHELTEKSKDLDRNTVAAVFKAIEAAHQEDLSFPGNPKDRDGFAG